MLPPGTRLGPYEIVALLGVGGMGEVYRATDTNLKRQVAIKVLPASVAADAERLARFQREAEILAALNHPNIAHIHGLEKSDGTVALVMELVEGPTLADRIAKGPILLDEALPISKQIAEALEAAHEQGIIHRDLKPANIKVRDDGTAKVLDFGLAKAMDQASGSGLQASGQSMSPTITSPAMTQAGVILGTAAYMSPEQAKGRPVDKRADIWAFGCVVYEMLTGKRPFDGEDVSDTLAFILTKDPDWTALPTDTPVVIRRLLRRCLEKGPRQRLDSAASARLDIEDALKREPVAPAPSALVGTSAPARHSARLPWAIAAATSMIAAAAVAVWAPWRVAPEPRKVSFEVQADISGVGAQTTIALSPDGRLLVALIGESGQSKLWLRPIDRTTWVPIQGTDAATYPFWCPDSRHIGFISGGKLKTVEVLAPTPQILVDNLGIATYGGAWSRDGVILFTKDFGPLFRVPASGGGQPVPATELDTSHGETAHRFPRFLPDGDHFLYLVLSATPEASGIYVGSLTSKGARRLVSSPTRADFAAPNLLLFLRDNSTLMAQRFDPRKLEALGDSFQVATGVTANAASGAGGFSVSDNGVLAVRTGGNNGERQLTWTDATGKADRTVDIPALYENPRLSPDGKRLAVFRQENGADIWISDLERNNSTRFTFDPGVDNIPVWSPDGKWIAFSSNRDGGVFNLYRKNAGGTGEDELLLKTGANKLVNDWTANGEFLLYQEDSPQTKIDLWMLPLSGDRKPTRLLGTPFSESEATVSPDGRWMAYTSDESGGRQVYVQTFPPSERKWRISNSRVAAHPRWRSDGKQLFFDSGGTLTVVDVLPSPAEEFKAPLELFRGLLNITPHSFDVADMGRRFLVVLTPQFAAQGAPPIVVTVNWTSGLPVAR